MSQKNKHISWEKKAKELECLYGISRLSEKRGANISEILQGTVKILAAVKLFAQDVCVKIIYEDIEYVSDKTCKCNCWDDCLQQNIIVKQKPVGGLKIYFKEPFDDTGSESQLAFLERITRRLGHIIENKLSEQELHFHRTITSTLPHPLALIDKEYRYLAVNEVYSSFYETTTEKILGHTVAEVCGKGLFESKFKKYLDLCLQGEEQNYELEVDFPKKGRRWMQKCYHPYRDENGQIIGVVSHGRDIHERKQAEQALKNSLRDFALAQRIASIGSWTLDGEEGTPELSDEVYRIYERDPVLGPFTLSEYKKIYKGESWKKFSNAIQGALHSGIPYDIELQLELPNGKTKWIHSICEPEKKSTDNGYFLRGVLQDISEQKQEDEKKQQLHEKLAHTQKMESLGVLVAGVAHEINNPNNSIMLNIPIIKNMIKYILPFLDKEYIEHGEFKIGNIPYSILKLEIDNLFNDVLVSSNRIKDIVKDLKDYSKDASNEVYSQLSINNIITSSLNLLKNMTKKMQVDINVDLAEDIPDVFGNFQKLEQVVINIIQNACQSAPGRVVHLNIYSSYAAKDNMVYLTVEDDGNGMTPEVLAHIMDPFFTTKRDIGGTGLGLSVSLGIIEKHNAEMTFDSAEGKGTAVTIKLPVTAGK